MDEPKVATGVDTGQNDQIVVVMVVGTTTGPVGEPVCCVVGATVEWWHPPLHDVIVMVEVVSVVMTCVPEVLVTGHTVVVVYVVRVSVDTLPVPVGTTNDEDQGI